VNRYCQECAHPLGQYDKICHACGCDTWNYLDGILAFLMSRIKELEKRADGA